MTSTSGARKVTQVDVLLPIKSPAPWLGATLESLNTQTFTDWQLVASIHGEDPEVRETVLAHVPYAKIVNAPGDGNLASTLNAGLRATTSPYVARIDADDLALPQRFQVQIDYLRNNPGVVLVGSGATIIGIDDEILGYRQQLEDPQKILRRLRWRSPLIHPSVMFLRESVISIGGYSEVATNVEDYDLWLRLGATGELRGINEYLIKYRVHPNQVSSCGAIPKAALRQVLNSGIRLALTEDKLVFAVYLRHSIWASRQFAWRLKRRYRT